MRNKKILVESRVSFAGMSFDSAFRFIGVLFSLS